MAAAEYNLQIIQENIETNKNNYTRFFVLSKGREVLEEANKSTLYFDLPHEPGSLVNALKCLNNPLLNLTKIQSVPIEGTPNYYHFYIDIEYYDKETFEKCIKKLQKKTKELVILGKYIKKELPPVKN